jgi:hypothetical protein
MTDEDLKTRRRAHDVIEAIKTLRLAVDDIASGYHFDDQFADDKLKVLQRIAEVLETEVDDWANFLRSPKS